MKLFTTIIVLQLATLTAFADHKIICNDTGLQDAQYTVLFTSDAAAQKITATLDVPTGKSSIESYSGDCDVNLGESDWDISISCKVATPEKTYSLLLIEDPELTVLVAADDNKLPPYRIPCRDL